MNGNWQLDYVLQNGLNLGVPYSVPTPASPSGLTPYPNPATDGLRNITGRINNDGTVTIWGVTSTISASGDQGADPNFLVSITDNLANTNPAGAAGESFVNLKAAQYGEVLRGVSFTPGTTATAAFVGADTTSQGNWKNTYGQDGEVIVGDGTNIPAYATITPSPMASTFVWAASGSDPRFLQKSTSPTDRVAGTYYSNSTFTIDLNLTPGTLHQVALYLLDEDTNARSETISILDANTSRVLDSRSVSGFHGGVYEVWNLQGHVLIEVTNTGGSNAVVSGIFLNTLTSTTAPTVSVTPVVNPVSLNATLTATATAGVGTTISTVQFFANGAAISAPLTGAGPTYTFAWPTTALPNGSYGLTAVATDSEGQTTTSSPVAATVTNTLSTSVSFVSSDATTEGTWKGTYGAGGDLIAFDSFAPPSYAVASFNQAPTYLWTTTNATQAMQRLSAPGRIASAWFAPLSFSLDVNFTDGNTHQLSLYFLDWDNASRAETVTLFDANTNSPISGPLDTETLSNFPLGKYLTWNIKGHVLIQFSKTAGSSAIVNGVFFNN